MTKTAPIVTSAVESHSTPTSNQTGRGLCIVAAGKSVQDCSSGSALRSASDARSIAAKPESSALDCVTSRPVSTLRISSPTAPPSAPSKGKSGRRSDMTLAFAGSVIPNRPQARARYSSPANLNAVDELDYLEEAEARHVLTYR